MQNPPTRRGITPAPNKYPRHCQLQYVFILYRLLATYKQNPKISELEESRNQSFLVHSQIMPHPPSTIRSRLIILRIILKNYCQTERNKNTTISTARSAIWKSSEERDAGETTDDLAPAR